MPEGTVSGNLSLLHITLLDLNIARFILCMYMRGFGGQLRGPKRRSLFFVGQGILKLECAGNACACCVAEPGHVGMRVESLHFVKNSAAGN